MLTPEILASPDAASLFGAARGSDLEVQRAEDRPPDHRRVEHGAEHQKEHDTGDDGSDIAHPPAFGDRGPSGIAAAREGDAVIDRPGQHRAEQDEPADVAGDQEVRDRPRLDAYEHRML